MAEIHVRSWEVAYKDIIPADFIHEKNATRLEMWRKMITEENATQYVIELDGKAVGILGLGLPRDLDLSDDYSELFAIYLHPDYYRQGIGTQAMRFAFDKAVRMGKTLMSVWVLAKNENAIRFYEKCGFTADGRTQTLNYGRELRVIRMIKSIRRSAF